MAHIGLFGGSFNPIHTGHLILTEIARSEANLDRILFVPAKKPPHKLMQRLADARDRLRMAELAIAENEFFEISEIELHRSGPSYTLLTVRELRKQLEPEDTLSLVVGADSVHEMPEWWHARELVHEVPIIALRRPGYPLQKLDRVKAEFGEKAVEQIKKQMVETPLLQISSTEIRERIRAGKTIRYMVPEKVREYILETRLYTGPE